MTSMKVEDIQIDQIEIGPTQVRTSDIEERIDDLVESIQVHGLLNPVSVYKKDDGKYELLAGQRRLLAVRRLGWKTIPAHILGRPKNDLIAKALSVTENLVIEPPKEADYVDACTSFYKHYGSIKEVAKQLGLPYHKVVKFVKYDRLPTELKKLYDEGKIKLDKALKAADMATDEEGHTDENEAVEIAKEIVKMSGSQVENMEKTKESRPDATAEELIEAGRTSQSVKIIKLELLVSNYEALKKFRKDEGKGSDEEAAVDLVVEGLRNRGLLDS